MTDPGDNWLSGFEVGRMYNFGRELLLEYVGVAMDVDNFKDAYGMEDFLAADTMVAVFRFPDAPTCHLLVARGEAHSIRPAFTDIDYQELIDPEDDDGERFGRPSRKRFEAMRRRVQERVGPTAGTTRASSCTE